MTVINDAEIAAYKQNTDGSYNPWPDIHMHLGMQPGGTSDIDSYDRSLFKGYTDRHIQIPFERFGEIQTRKIILLMMRNIIMM